MTHRLKTHPQPFRAVRDGSKLFEIRKDDRGFAVGHVLQLEEFHPSIGYTGKTHSVRVGYILRSTPDFGLMDGFCIMSVHPV